MVEILSTRKIAGLVWFAALCGKSGNAFPTARSLSMDPKFNYLHSKTQLESTISSRRSWAFDLSKTIAISSTAVISGTYFPSPSVAQDQFDPNDPEIQEIYNNANMPEAPEERSGLVVLRVAEVSQFQEKILRAVVNGDLKDVMVSPMQFAFGTQILLRNSNLDGNMKLMIQEEIPRGKRAAARKNAATVMNTLQAIQQYAASIQRDFEPIEMVELADMYVVVRANLNQLYEYLPEKEREKYYGYFVAVTEYEKKIANGTYNPDIDGVLKFD